jgi:hypothetical protein
MWPESALTGSEDALKVEGVDGGRKILVVESAYTVPDELPWCENPEGWGS